MNQQTNAASSKDRFPQSFLHLVSVAKIGNACEGLIVFLHSCMLEVGFIPQGVDEYDVNKCMPENWTDSGISNILYHHKSIPDTICRMTCIPLYSNLAVHGILENNQSSDSTVHLNVEMSTQGDISDPSSLFRCPQELSIFLKDRFCFRLLSLLQDSVNYRPSFGLSELVEDVMFLILPLLPVKSIVSLSAVSKDFYNKVNSPHLWKLLYIRDYGSDELLTDDPSTSEVNWKERYKREYIKNKKRESRTSFQRYLPYNMPQIFPVRPDFGSVDPRIDLDPALQQAFPLLRNRFPPTTWFPPGPFQYGRWYW